MRHLRSVLIVAIMAASSYTADAQDSITLLATGGIRASIEQLIPGFESKTGHKIEATWTSVTALRREVTQGTPFDVLSMPSYPEVIASGNVVPDSARTLASVYMGVTVRKGAPKPDISTPAAVKRMLLSAKSISFNTGFAGVSFEDTLKKLGIADQMEPKIKRAKNSEDMIQKIADGEAEIGFTYISELLSGAQGFPPNPNIVAVGTLPKEISDPLTLVGFVSAHAKNPATARAFLDYISSHDAASVYTAHAMQPGR